MIEFHDRIAVPGGKEREVIALGVSRQYLNVRNLQVLSGGSSTTATHRHATKSR